MTNDITAEDILQAVNFRKGKAGPGICYDIAARTSYRSREELNNKTTKELNNSFRLSEDASGVQSPLRQTPSEAVVQKDFGSSITPARTSYRYTGIAVQHCKARPAAQRPGIKLAVSLQTTTMAEHGHLLLLTAELKRYDRLREIKSKLDDSSAFAQLLEQAKHQVYADQDREIIMGRLHLRGKRTAWIPNALVIGRMVSGQISQVILCLDAEEYIIKLDHPVTQAQQPLYAASGQWGSIAHPNSRSPSLADIIRERFGS
jgi:hypothetical protein